MAVRRGSRTARVHFGRTNGLVSAPSRPAPAEMRVRGEMGGIETICLAVIMARPSRPYQGKFSELELLKIGYS